MAHIVTNHSLRPHSLTGDALDTSLSVSVPRLIRFLTLGFGYHVEHHLMPTVSHRHGPTIQALLKQDFPRRYRELPLRVALLRVCRAPRVHRSAAVLVDPLTQRELTLSLPPAALQQETDLSQVRSPGASWPLEATYSS